MAPVKSLAALAKKLGKSKTSIATWSAKYDWQSRLETARHEPPVRHSAPDDGGSTPSGSPPINTGLQPGERQPIALPAVSTASPSELSTLNYPWERHPREPDKAFLAFGVYLALGPERTLGKASQATARSKHQLSRWSMRWHWRARALAYHAHLADVERRATETLVAEKSRDWVAMHESVRRQAWQEGEDLIAISQDFKARWRDSDRLPDFGAIVRALELAFRLKQFAAGMPSEIKAVNTTHTGPGGGPIKLEFEAALEKIYSAPIPGEILDIESTPAPATPVGTTSTSSQIPTASTSLSSSEEERAGVRSSIPSCSNPEP
jgi:hypothetical protein